MNNVLVKKVVEPQRKTLTDLPINFKHLAIVVVPNDFGGDGGGCGNGRTSVCLYFLDCFFLRNNFN